MTGARGRGTGRIIAALCCCLPALAACDPPAVRIDPDPAAAESCPPQAEAPAVIPGAPAERAQLSYWLSRPEAGLDRVLMPPAAIAAYNARVGRGDADQVAAQQRLDGDPSASAVAEDLGPRLAYLRERLDDGQYVTAGGGALSPEVRARFDAHAPALQPSLHVALTDIPLRCGPLDGPLHKSHDDPFDRNACSMIRTQEPVQRIAPWPGPGDQASMWLVRTRYAVGFVALEAALSPAVTEAAQVRALVHGPHVRLPQATEIELAGARRPLPRHARLPVWSDDEILMGTEDGLRVGRMPPAAVPTRRPLTRRALWTTAFQFMDTPYGFGGQAGGRDCSRFLLDLFESFDLALPRHSGWQAEAGTERIDFAADAPATDKLAAIDAAHARGVVLMYFPGHIMLYLGRDDRDVPMALHALGEYADPCPGGGETVRHVGRMVVTDLSLGEGSSRRAFIERITRLVVFAGGKADAGEHTPDDGHTTGPGGPGAPAGPPPPARCRGDVDHRIFTSPAKPALGQRVRIIATASEDPGAATLRVFGPDRAHVPVQSHPLGGPPHTRWAWLEPSAAGYYTAVLGTKDRVDSCKRFAVRRIPAEPEAPTATNGETPVWAPSWKWERDTENLWSAFVERLFEYPPDDGRTWTNLQDLLRDEERNLLFGHLGLDEDTKLKLEPDCADLPYVLRAYFAWKLRLPFGFRRCARGRPGRPPSCGQPRTNMLPSKYADPVEAFEHFARREVMRSVHSASGRTHPADDRSDHYPVALTRRGIPPGTVYSDPYGHVMLVADWVPQGDGKGEYGILIASEAQPDGTIGRRRFWRGSFLFDPATDDVGAGFKRFRPMVVSEESGEVVALDNDALRASKAHEPFSMQQYEMTEDAFYTTMDALINPRPLDPKVRMESLVDALRESVLRRVIAVDNGEQHMRDTGYATMDMPSGHDLFETQGPWEDFSTPARDMRMLISIDTVVDFPEQVAATPSRYGLKTGGEAVKKRLRAQLDTMLRSFEFEYTRSDGRTQKLTLADVATRAGALELGYNPNDCIELRWGAPEGSAERASCERRAPKEQQTRMREYRRWFQNRKRPPRGTR